jgi:hypothetical protein
VGTKGKKVGRWAAATASVALLMGVSGAGHAADASAPYPAMAPIAQYSMASADEIALARSAAPASISADADILVLGAHGYDAAVKGKNGFVCLVQRSWTTAFEDPEFWNPKMRSPVCLNPAAARSVLPHVLELTKWVLAGVPRTEMIERTKAELAAKTYVLPEPGAMSYMMSKDGYLNDAGGHWHPHLMFYVANADDATWGANLAGSPVLDGGRSPLDPVTIFLVPVAKWSDGTAMAMK